MAVLRSMWPYPPRGLWDCSLVLLFSSWLMRAVFFQYVFTHDALHLQRAKSVMLLHHEPSEL